MSAKGVDLQQGGTYRHYKTQGLYTVLQLVRFDNRGGYPTDATIQQVTFSGDGPLKNRFVSLVLAFVPRVRLYLQDDFGTQGDALQVLYWSQEQKRYFVRPLTEFIAQVDVDGVVRPRFALVQRQIPFPGDGA